MRSEQDGNHLQAQEREANHEEDLILGCQPPEVWENKFKLQSLWYLIMKSLANQ